MAQPYKWLERSGTSAPVDVTAPALGRQGARTVTTPRGGFPKEAKR